MQSMQFRAKNAKNDLKPTDFLKHIFSFEIEGVASIGVHGFCNKFVYQAPKE